MNHIIETFKYENSLDWLIEYAEYDSDDHNTTDDTIDADIEAWARHALASNGFGDY